MWETHRRPRATGGVRAPSADRIRARARVRDRCARETATRACRTARRSTSGEWLGSMMPPAPTRMRRVPPATCAMTHRRRRAGDARHVVMLGQPEATIAQTLGVPREVEAVAERRRGVAAFHDRARDRARTTKSRWFQGSEAYTITYKLVANDIRPLKPVAEREARTRSPARPARRCRLSGRQCRRTTSKDMAESCGMDRPPCPAP